jgi:hypothetical protein
MNPAVTLAAFMVVLTLTGTPFMVKLPEPTGLTTTDRKLFGGVSKASVKPKSAATKV